VGEGHGRTPGLESLWNTLNLTVLAAIGHCEELKLDDLI
jgi:hypothetical protein